MTDAAARLFESLDWHIALLVGIACLSAQLVLVTLNSRGRNRSAALARLSEAMDVMPEGLAFYDADDRAVIWNARYSELNTEGGSAMKAGITFRELLQIGLSVGHYPEALGREEEWLEQRMALHFSGRATHEQRLADGRWFRIEERRTGDGGILSVIEDITELKRREESLRLMFESNPVPMWAWEVGSYRFLAVNEAAVAHYGYPRERFLGMTVLDIIALEHRDEMRQVMEQPGSSSYRADRTWKHVKADGSVIDVLPYVQSLTYEGRPAHVSALFDVTVRNRAEEAMAQARDQAERANRAKSEFLANMSHEIRTPLNGVTGVAQVLSRTALAPDQQEMVRIIEQSALTLERLLSDVLDLARVESGRIEIQNEPFHLADTVRATAALSELRAQEKDVAFRLEIDPQAEGLFDGDSGRLKQILFNLLSNALKFTEQGHVALRVTADGGLFRFEVEDTGVGFDPCVKEKLFTRFEQEDGSITRRFGGTGLGLAISRELAGLMGGRMDARSVPGEGATFILELPLAPVEAPARTETVHAPAVDAASCGLRVLLAEDHDINRKVVELMLDCIGCDLTSVEDGEEAVKAVIAHRYDIVLMDMQMPVMDGLTAIRLIRQHEQETGAPRTPVFTLSANAMQEHIEASLAAGADRHLTKPITAAALLGALADVGRAKAEREAA